ncbi:MAG: alpha-(1-_3)-arabinofuranosyltransferase domain-containing protein, partial [Acidimicrobiales bacterium]
SEVLRGLGYWFFYGQDKLGPWIQPAIDYTQRLWLIGVSFALPALAFLSAALVRWRYRAYFVGLILVGTVLAVGIYPYNEPSPIGQLLKSAATSSTVGLAMRSTDRAVPLVILGTAVLLGVGLSALVRRARMPGLVMVGVVTALVAADIFPLWTGTVIGGNLVRPEKIPSYWTQAANYLDTKGKAPAGGYQTRVLGLPGEDFASYRWGNTVDPVLPGLMDRPYVAREIFPYGTPGTVDLLNSLDNQLQEGTFVPSSLAPVARIMSVGDVLLQSDLQYERYNTPRPKPTWALFNPTPPGLTPPQKFGNATPNVSTQFPLLDEIALGEPSNSSDPPPVATFAVSGPRDIVRA